MRIELFAKWIADGRPPWTASKLWEILGGFNLKHTRIPGVVNIFEVNDPQEIKSLAKNPVIDRQFETRTCPINWLLLKRSLSVLSFRGRRFPTMEPRDCATRARAQQGLWSRLNDETDDIKAGPVVLEPLAEWVRGVGSDAEAGIRTQQLLGRLFRSDFNATEESWAAARVLVAAPRSSNLLKLGWWFVTGKVRRAKRLLAGMVGDDLSAVNAIGIAVHNLVKSLRHMRSLYAAANSRNVLSAEAAAGQCLRAPVSLYRQSTDRGTLMGDRFPKNSLFVLNIGTASQLSGGRSLVFMEESWSACPASTWVPAMLEGVWRRALRQATT
jgi:hypothetical protein